MKSFFTDDEMKCPCCGKLMMDIVFMKRLNMAGWFAGFPFIVGSGYRCPEHNKKVGSSSNNHTSGMAADIKCTGAQWRFDVVKAMIGAGMMGVGIGLMFVHCDINREKPAIWTY